MTILTLDSLPPMDVAARAARVRPAFAEAGIDALLVTHLPNVRYLTGFTGSSAMLLVTDDALVFTSDGRYRTQAAEQLAAAGVECEVVDLRTTSPLDEDTVLESVENTGRLVVVDEAHPRCSVATDISALVAKKAFGALRAPIEMVTAPHTPVPFSSTLEDLYIPDAQRIVNAVKTVAEWTR